MAEKMNLSARLDRARAQREAGLAPDPGRDNLHLRFLDEDGQAYAGRGIRTGEQLTEEQWAARSELSELPTWRRRLADARTEPVIDLTDETMGGRPAASSPVCPSCGHDVDIETIDLADESVKLGCPSCGRIWRASQSHPTTH